MKHAPMQPARNVRQVDPRCCNTCAFLTFEGTGMAFCLRPGGPEFDVGDRRHDYTVCDLWRSQLRAPLKKNEDAL